MMEHPPFSSWQAVLDAPHSAFFRGHTSDAVFDRQSAGRLSPHMEALFTQSNARVLLGQAADGSLRFIALPTQVYAAPTGLTELGLGPGMYHHFDVAMYVGDLAYRIEPEGAAPIDLAAGDRDNETHYADWFLPLTRTQAGDLDVSLISLAPVAPDAEQAPLSPAPLPGPAGALYLLRLRNTGASRVKGRVVLRAGDMLVGHYEDASPALRPLKRPTLDLRQRTLILSRPDGSVGIHAHEGQWVRLEADPFEAEWPLDLAPDEEALYETYLALGKTYHDVMPTVYALHLRPVLEWANLTAAFWRERLGRLTLDADGAGEEARFSLENHIRNLLDNFNCLQTDAEGNLTAHWQGAPYHGYGTVWGIDVEPTAVSVCQAVPELARQTMLFFLRRSHAPIGLPEHSVPILVAPVIIARQWLQATGDTAFRRMRSSTPADIRAMGRSAAATITARTPRCSMPLIPSPTCWRRSVAVLTPPTIAAGPTPSAARSSGQWSWQGPLARRSRAAPTWARTRRAFTCPRMCSTMTVRTRQACWPRSMAPAT